MRGIILGGGVLLEIEALVKSSFVTWISVEGGGSSIKQTNINKKINIKIKKKI